MEEKKKVMIDAGHGGTKDPGAVFEDRMEKDDTLRLALAVGRILEENGVNAVYTRTTDVYDTPYQKAEMGNEAEADYFVSLHRNAASEPGKVVVKGLFEKYPNVAALADAPVEDIEAIVKPCGLGHSKARDISACMKMLRDEYGGHVPDDFNALLKLPGVGRKSANLIMGDVFGKPAIVTDTHCIRLVNRIGLVEGIKDPKRVEMALWKLIPPEEGSDFCHRLVYHGREVCTARTKPYCDKCCLQDICAKADVE